MTGQTTDLGTLESDLMARIESANDEAALETLRVEALGKQGSISSLMKNLGAMSPDQRKSFGAALNVLKDKVTEAFSPRRRRWPRSRSIASCKAKRWT